MQALLTIALVAAQATSPKKDRAVVTGARNFFRTIGGAFGLGSKPSFWQYSLIAVCSAIMNNVLASRLAQETDLSPEVRQAIIRSSLELPRNLTPEQMATVMSAYSDGIKAIFIMNVPLGALCLIMALFVIDAGLPDDKQKEEVRRDSEIIEDGHQSDEEGRLSAEVPGSIPVTEKGAGRDMESRIEKGVEKFA